MRSQLRLFLNFWESKQLEYWLQDNYPDLTIRSLYDKFSQPEEKDWYAIEGKIDVDTECIIKLKYGNKVSTSNAGLKHG